MRSKCLRVWVAIVGSIAVGFGTAAAAAQPLERLEAKSNVIDIREGDELFKQSWTLSKEVNPDIKKVNLAKGQRQQICFISQSNSLCRTVGVGETSDFIITYDGYDYPTRVEGVYVPPAARFDAKYRSAHRGKVTTLIPEVYELVNVAIALTPFAQEPDRYLVVMDTPYFTALKRHFAGVAGHPFVKWLDAEMRRDMGLYFNHKMDGYSFVYDRNGRIVRSPIYDRTAFPGASGNSLLPMLAQMRDFSAKSKFRQFYAAHRPLYRQQVQAIEQDMDIDGMVAWLKREFPRVKPYDHIKIVFSPLVYGSQSVTWMESNGFKELQPHVNFPYAHHYKLPMTDKAIALMRGDLLFTEINHGFINPTADGYPAEIDAALGERKNWVREGQTTKGYPNNYSVFNEMMNWGLVNLYYVDRAPAADLDALIAQNNRHQSKGRGFIRFPEFSDFLVKLYRERPAGTTVADLYPQIIAWFAANRGTNNNPTSAEAEQATPVASRGSAL
ncbi:DUF4932 domain-containing protein [Sphingomonas sinipercae]|uniref:DUF4932 domain-containing protein n=1 Tax=Sphingomonas sinipercae TaxID=2714944 RepID=A0A6G7ZLM3_9SPHN|nr:DUF4932 domain-containing protein [Sphingomonas sinipercae]QIL01825.1 DUF4932 domain-containing protein [Sphingomonas sinipercae]